MDTSLQVLIYIGIVLLALLIIAVVYLIFALRRINIFFKKADYLVEDWTYKSEMLNSGVEAISNIQNYIDAFNAATKRNLKSFTTLAFRNRNMVYYLVNKIRDNVKDAPKSSTSKTLDEKKQELKKKQDELADTKSKKIEDSEKKNKDKK